MAERVVGSYAAAIQDLEPAVGQEPPRLQGEGSAALRQRHLREGNEITPPLREAIDQLSR
jgi:hypothetical protein